MGTLTLDLGDYLNDEIYLDVDINGRVRSMGNNISSSINNSESDSSFGKGIFNNDTLRETLNLLQKSGLVRSESNIKPENIDQLRSWLARISGNTQADAAQNNVRQTEDTTPPLEVHLTFSSPVNKSMLVQLANILKENTSSVNFHHLLKPLIRLNVTSGREAADTKSSGATSRSRLTRAYYYYHRPGQQVPQDRDSVTSLSTEDLRNLQGQEQSLQDNTNSLNNIWKIIPSVRLNLDNETRNSMHNERSLRAFMKNAILFWNSALRQAEEKDLDEGTIKPKAFNLNNRRPSLPSTELTAPSEVRENFQETQVEPVEQYARSLEQYARPLEQYTGQQEEYVGQLGKFIKPSKEFTNQPRTHVNPLNAENQPVKAFTNSAYWERNRNQRNVWDRNWGQQIDWNRNTNQQIEWNMNRNQQADWNRNIGQEADWNNYRGQQDNWNRNKGQQIDLIRKSNQQTAWDRNNNQKTDWNKNSDRQALQERIRDQQADWVRKNDQQDNWNINMNKQTIWDKTRDQQDVLDNNRARQAVWDGNRARQAVWNGNRARQADWDGNRGRQADWDGNSARQAVWDGNSARQAVWDDNRSRQAVRESNRAGQDVWDSNRARDRNRDAVLDRNRDQQAFRDRNRHNNAPWNGKDNNEAVLNVNRDTQSSWNGDRDNSAVWIRKNNQEASNKDREQQIIRGMDRKLQIVEEREALQASGERTGDLRHVNYSDEINKERRINRRIAPAERIFHYSGGGKGDILNGGDFVAKGEDFFGNGRDGKDRRDLENEGVGVLRKNLKNSGAGGVRENLKNNGDGGAKEDLGNNRDGRVSEDLENVGDSVISEDLKNSGAVLKIRKDLKNAGDEDSFEAREEEKHLKFNREIKNRQGNEDASAYIAALYERNLKEDRDKKDPRIDGDKMHYQTREDKRGDLENGAQRWIPKISWSFRGSQQVNGNSLVDPFIVVEAPDLYRRL
nr:uncharacterized protein LOC128696037 [Cherax quadricarinatus]